MASNLPRIFGGGKQLHDDVHLLSQSSSINLSGRSVSPTKRDLDDYELRPVPTKADLRHARTLHKTAFERLLGIGPELVLFSITFPVFALAVTVVRFDGKIVKEPEWSRLETEIKIVNNPAFPFAGNWHLKYI